MKLFIKHVAKKISYVLFIVLFFIPVILTSCGGSGTKINVFSQIDEVCRTNSEPLQMHTFTSPNNDADIKFLSQNISAQNIVNGYLYNMIYIYRNTYGALFDTDLKSSKYSITKKNDQSKLDITLKYGDHESKVKIDAKKLDDLSFKIDVRFESNNNAFSTKVTSNISKIYKFPTLVADRFIPLNSRCIEIAGENNTLSIPLSQYDIGG
jgi:hypothetical protein